MTVTEQGAGFAGAGCRRGGQHAAARAASPRAARARAWACAPIAVADADRAAYHAAASIASNFLVTLEAAAERLAATAGRRPRRLAPLVRATVENWAAARRRRAP